MLDESCLVAEQSLKCSTSPATADVRKMSLRTLRYNRNPGTCIISSELLRAGGKFVILWVTHIINAAWILEKLHDN